jgi:SAM-dependent methyltransferase
LYYRIILRILEEFGGDLVNPKILDFGCGTGNIALELRKLSFDVYGVDIDKRSVEEVRHKFSENKFEEDRIRLIDSRKEFFEIKSDYKLPFETGFFDCIYAYQVFEHISDMDKALQELGRVLKPGGFIFAEFPSSYSIIEPHLKIPFVHWLPYSRFRIRYINFFYKLGIGLYPHADGESHSEYLKKGVFYKGHREMDSILSRYFYVKDIGYFRRKIIFDKNGVFTLSDLMKYLLGLKNIGQSHENKTGRSYLVNTYIHLYTYFYSLFRNRSLILIKRT